jgi:hypothetical protein
MPAKGFVTQCQAIVDVHQSDAQARAATIRCTRASVSYVRLTQRGKKRVYLCWLHKAALKNPARRTQLFIVPERRWRRGGAADGGTTTERSGSTATASESSSASAAPGLPESSASPAGDE